MAVLGEKKSKHSTFTLGCALVSSKPGLAGTMSVEINVVRYVETDAVTSE